MDYSFVFVFFWMVHNAELANHHNHENSHLKKDAKKRSKWGDDFGNDEEYGKVPNKFPIGLWKPGSKTHHYEDDDEQPNDDNDHHNNNYNRSIANIVRSVISRTHSKRNSFSKMDKKNHGKWDGDKGNGEGHLPSANIKFQSIEERKRSGDDNRPKHNRAGNDPNDDKRDTKKRSKWGDDFGNDEEYGKVPNKFPIGLWKPGSKTHHYEDEDDQPDDDNDHHKNNYNRTIEKIVRALIAHKSNNYIGNGEEPPKLKFKSVGGRKRSGGHKRPKHDRVGTKKRSKWGDDYGNEEEYGKVPNKFPIGLWKPGSKTHHYEDEDDQPDDDKHKNNYNRSIEHIVRGLIARRHHNTTFSKRYNKNSINWEDDYGNDEEYQSSPNIKFKTVGDWKPSGDDYRPHKSGGNFSDDDYRRNTKKRSKWDDDNGNDEEYGAVPHKFPIGLWKPGSKTHFQEDDDDSPDDKKKDNNNDRYDRSTVLVDDDDYGNNQQFDESHNLEDEDFEGEDHGTNRDKRTIGSFIKDKISTYLSKIKKKNISDNATRRSGGSGGEQTFHNHRRNRILLMKDEVFNLFTTPEGADKERDDGGEDTGEIRHRRSIEKYVEKKSLLANDRLQQHKNQYQRTEKIPTGNLRAKEIIPTVEFSHNGTYKYGASPKIVQDAKIDYNGKRGSIVKRKIKRILFPEIARESIGVKKDESRRKKRNQTVSGNKRHLRDMDLYSGGGPPCSGSKPCQRSNVLHGGLPCIGTIPCISGSPPNEGIPSISGVHPIGGIEPIEPINHCTDIHSGFC